MFLEIALNISVDMRSYLYPKKIGLLESSPVLFSVARYNYPMQFLGCKSKYFVVCFYWFFTFSESLSRVVHSVTLCPVEY